jgi:sugar/nucleoside kinase (ribokinase family)
MSERILVIGDVIDDIIVIPGRAIRHDTDTPASISQRAGGSSANTAAWLGFAGADVDFYGCVGQADLARHSHELAQFGVRTFLNPDEIHPTGTIVILVEGEARTMLTDRGANIVLDLDEVPDALLADAGFLHLTGHTVLDAPDRQAITRLIARAHDAGVRVSVDPASAGFIDDFGVELFLSLIAGADILRPNEDEVTVLSGLMEPVAASEKLTELFPLVVTTLGGNGVIVAERGKPAVRFATDRVEVVDPTGAGDTFNAGLLAGLAKGLDPVEAAHQGARLAASGLKDVGARPIHA